MFVELVWDIEEHSRRNEKIIPGEERIFCWRCRREKCV